MKIGIQDSLSNPTDYRYVDSADFHLEPVRPLPVGGEVIDDQRGYYHKLCCQGIGLTGDHHSVKHLIDGCEITSWSDDLEDEQDHPAWLPTDPPEWWFRAHVIRFREIAPDENLGNALNTNTTRTLYAGRRVLEEWNEKAPSGYQGMVIKPWEEFILPLDPRHGIWVPSNLHVMHEQALSPQNWRAWSEHLDPSEVDENGLLKPQYEQGRMSPPQGTITYFLRDINQASGVHIVNHENEMNDTAGTGETEASQAYSAGEDNLEFLWTTLASNPNVVDWPNGLYENQSDCSAIDLDMSYGLLTLGVSAGHFAVVNSGLTAHTQATWAQSQAAFVAAGLNLASQTEDPSSGQASDRFECVIAGARAAGCHGNQTFTMRYNSDSFGRGPWVVAGGRIMSSLAGAGGLADRGGIAGFGGGLAG